MTSIAENEKGTTVPAGLKRMSNKRLKIISNWVRCPNKIKGNRSVVIVQSRRHSDHPSNLAVA